MPTPTDFDVDLARDVAAWQRGNGQVPRDLSDLLVELKTRIAVGPP
jgi:hypothetical protein